MTEEEHDAKLRAEAQALREEVAEYEALCNRQAELLSQSIVAIRGPEPELTRWGYADLPLRVKTIVEEVEALRARVLVLPDSSTVYAALDARERLFTSPENIRVALEAQSRLNGKTVSERLLLRVLYAISELGDRHLTAIEMQSARELRALLNQDKENGNG
ncbi:hypothetical protein ACRCRN_23410 [Pseudomonas aeruginosa]|uniref:hypothetical protein n=1 Tax=Pseudomonas aeruginosa TaxID=287 RepID=UPI001CA4EA8E|nr:hypothetical protein [Pseudomonas aeruginosa]